MFVNCPFDSQSHIKRPKKYCFAGVDSYWYSWIFPQHCIINFMRCCSDDLSTGKQHQPKDNGKDIFLSILCHFICAECLSKCFILCFGHVDLNTKRTSVCVRVRMYIIMKKISMHTFSALVILLNVVWRHYIVWRSLLENISLHRTFAENPMDVPKL